MRLLEKLKCRCIRLRASILLGQHFEQLCHRDSKLGGNAVKGHWSTDVHRKHELDIDFDNNFTWNYGQQWADIIAKHLVNIPYKSPYIVFSGGIWNSHGLDSEDTQNEILEALRKNDIVGIYRTTTYKRGTIRSPYSLHDEHLCSKTQYCLNVSWTGQIDSDLYADDVHFYSEVYNRMNLQLLDILRSHDKKQ